ncbi:MAG TPA: enoyl-CoA hydratase-related protein, partial [Terriglobia bacterium]|nr:enoyl-CoA hydratase-related protein [Terriglobia bacterium]
AAKRCTEMGWPVGPTLNKMLKVDVRKPIASVILNRPDVHNAFNDELVKLVTDTFTELGARDDVRVIVFGGNGKSFCAGADLNWMKRMVQYSHDQNVEDARAIGRMYLTIAKCPKPVIARIHGAALGGGAGLVAACDIAVAVESVQFGFTEVKLGIIPAIIAPFVIARVGPGRAREFFITGERFLAPVALNIGLIQHVAAHELALDALIDSKVSQILTSAPGAIAAAKELIFGVAARNLESSLEFAAEAIAMARASAEGQAGMQAFLERQKPPWIEKAEKTT